MDNNLRRYLKKPVFSIVFVFYLLVLSSWVRAAEPPDTRLQGHVPHHALQHAKALGRLAMPQTIALTVSLPLQNSAELKALIARQQDPNDPEYGHYLTPQEFTERFAPSASAYQAVVDHFTAHGFTIARKHSNRQLLSLEANPTQIESALQVKMQRYENSDGREFYAPDSEPLIPGSLAKHVLHVSGLNNAVVRHSYAHPLAAKTSHSIPASIGSGPEGGLTPTDIAAAYNAHPNTAASQYPQTLAVLELADYYPEDISYYQSYFKLNNMTLKNVAVDGGVPRSRRGRHGQSSETTLDIELLMALAPADSTILVYEGPNTDSGFLDILNQMATDNTAKLISCSWGSSEDSNTSSYMQTENQIFQQMAAQGQAFIVAAGDSGAYDNGSKLSVDDPGAQPYVTAVGGTQLSLLSNGAFGGESTWNNGSANAGAGGGGISSIWAIPAYQKGIPGITSAAKRNVPDVALNADPDTGYAIYYHGSWSVYGGTSCAAPLWTSFIAQLNQERLSNGAPSIGFMNPRLYALANSSNYAFAFHDVADGSNNLKYVAKAGYDNATGWGSFNGGNLLATLATDQPAAVPVSAATVTVVTLNGGESVKAGTKLLLQWSSSSIAAKKRLSAYFSKNAGKSWTLISSSLHVIGSLQWKVSKAQRTTQGLIRVCLPKSGKVAAVCDDSDAIFSIY